MADFHRSTPLPILFTADHRIEFRELRGSGPRDLINEWVFQAGEPSSSTFPGPAQEGRRPQWGRRRPRHTARAASPESSIAALGCCISCNIRARVVAYPATSSPGLLQGMQQAAPACCMRRDKNPGMLRKMQPSATNGPEGTTKEPEDPTPESRESTNDPGLSTSEPEGPDQRLRGSGRPFRRKGTREAKRAERSRSA